MSLQEYQKQLALIGIGRWGKNLARNFHHLGALHTLCDMRQTALDVYQEMYPDVIMETDFQKVLDNPEITCVAIAAPAIQHYALTKQALLAGKDVYVEKPLCLDCQEAEELISIAKMQERILMVGHLLQYHPAVKKVQDMVAEGVIGKLQYIVSNRLNLGHYRTEENALWNFAPHDVSVILSLCSHQLPKQVRCMGASYISKGIADTTMTTLVFDNDVKAHIYVSWLNPFKEQKLIITGSAGMIVFDDTLPWDNKVVLYRNHVTWTNGRIPEVGQCHPEPIELEHKEPLREECRHFLNCCQTRQNPLTDGKEGMRVLQVLQAAESSMASEGEARDPLQYELQNGSNAPKYNTHPTAVIDATAHIGAGTHIWHFSHIMHDCLIGEKCNIGQNVVVSPKVTLGKNVKVQNNVSIYTGVTCEDDVFLGPSMVFTNVLNPRSAVSRKDQYLPTIVRKGATIGANATIVCGIELGHHCFIGAGAVVTKDVKPYALIVGNPGKQIGWMSRYGEKLDLPLEIPQGEELIAHCPHSGEKYRLSGTHLHCMEESCEKTLADIEKLDILSVQGVY